jgi:hypothetical protein
MVLFSRSAATASQTPPPSKSLPWYRGLWWSIWITLIATVFIYGITTALIFRFLVAPSIIAEREAIRMENEQTRQEYHQYIREQRDSYYRQLQEWREHAPPPEHLCLHLTLSALPDSDTEAEVPAVKCTTMSPPAFSNPGSGWD